MRCDQFQQGTSAAMDGEASGLGEPALERHRRSCAGCAAWEAGVASTTRRLRVREAPSLPGGLTAQIMATVARPGRRLRRRWVVLRWALLIIAAAQLALAVPALLGDGLGMAMSLHASHESAAWNAAVGVALVIVAARPARVAGALSILAPFVGVLVVLSGLDLASGQVGVDRLVTHLGAVLGVAVLTGLAWLRRGLPTGDPQREAFAVPTGHDLHQPVAAAASERHGVA